MSGISKYMGESSKYMGESSKYMGERLKVQNICVKVQNFQNLKLLTFKNLKPCSLPNI